MIALGMLASACLLPSILPHAKIKSPARRGKLLDLGPQFILQKMGGVASSTLVLTFSNAGRTDLECWVEWLDCRATNAMAVPEIYGGLRGKVLVGTRQTNQVRLTTLCLSNGMAGRVCCYCVHWQQAPSWFARNVPPRPWSERVLRLGDGWLWPVAQRPWNQAPEQGWVVGSNLSVPEFFRQVYGLEADDLAKEKAAEEAVDAANLAALAMARLKLFHVRAGIGPAGEAAAVTNPPTDHQAIIRQAEEEVAASERALAASGRDARLLRRREAREVYEQWLRQREDTKQRSVGRQ
jgi:hypothetical protein